MPPERETSQHDRRRADMTQEWRAHINTEITEIKRRLDEGAATMERNTELTSETRDDLAAFVKRATPTLEVTEPMLRGAAAIGRFGAFLDKWGTRALKFGMFALGVWLGVKVLVAGGSWFEAVKAFSEVQK